MDVREKLRIKMIENAAEINRLHGRIQRARKRNKNGRVPAANFTRSTKNSVFQVDLIPVSTNGYWQAIHG